MAVGTIGFLTPKNILLDTRIKSIVSVLDNSKRRFQVAAILKSKMADVKRKVQLAQYLKMFTTY